MGRAHAGSSGAKRVGLAAENAEASRVPSPSSGFSVHSPRARITRAPRWYVTYAQAHSNSTTKRLRNPIRNTMWIASHRNHARKPEQRKRPEVRDRAPTSDRRQRTLVDVAKRLAWLAAQQPHDVLARDAPHLHRGRGDAGARVCRRLTNAAASPITNTRSSPSIDKSSRTGTRPARSSGTSERRRATATRERRHPTAPVRAAMRSSPSTTAAGVDRLHASPERDLDAETFELALRRRRTARGGKLGNTRSSPSTSSTRAERGSKLRKS
jgi:hypothetical protein